MRNQIPIRIQYGFLIHLHSFSNFNCVIALNFHVCAVHAQIQ